jgi:hypothetical protein
LLIVLDSSSDIDDLEVAVGQLILQLTITQNQVLSHLDHLHHLISNLIKAKKEPVNNGIWLRMMSGNSMSQ